MPNNIQIKICDNCGRELPLNRYTKIYGKNYRKICKECDNFGKIQNRYNKYLKEYCVNKSMHIQRKYKEIIASRILPMEISGIEYISKGEKFVKLLYYRETWISTYGRVIIKIGEKYKLLNGFYSRADNELYYILDKNVNYNTKAGWGYIKIKVRACDLVIQTFIVNYDMQNNIMVWHDNNDKTDNYYKNLYPVTKLQYNAIKKVYDNLGVIWEEQIMNIVNAVEYKYKTWNPYYLKRSFEGIAYLGTDDADYKSPEFNKWINMIQRCYNKKIQKNKPYYKDKTVCEEWLNFANFRIWFREYVINGDKVDIDKDILFQGNKIYSPETCVFVEHYINTMFENRGMKCNIVMNADKKYVASCVIKSEKKEFGVFNTKEEAIQGYIKGKKKCILELAEEYKGKVQDCLYNAMINWNVEVYD